MDNDNLPQIVTFFEAMIGLKDLFKNRDRSIDAWGIPGFESVLENWVMEKALGPIPSKEALSYLTEHVGLNLN